MEENPSSSRTDRKFIERNRRNQMKALYSKLYSLVPHQSSMEANSLQDQIGEATSYIKNLQMKLEKLKEKKNKLIGIDRSKYPQFEIQQTCSTLEVVLITGLDCQFMFNATIRVLHEEGLDIVNASYAVVEDTVFHTIHCQVGESANGAARISEKLRKF
ncbi:transcription factor bHLH162-like [Gastrolobium bilobum]|uniref:transcription factor bHLH162-like n=1 Tax=Gastrolobium bilobum TaxID=150636 RepID=UPI002AAF3737|nr:transcription factor bHLH162-like [Gastrolobium bilobum]